MNAARLTCSDNKVIERVEFVAFGDPDGACGAFKAGKCNSLKAQKVVEKQCLGNPKCVVKFDKGSLQDDKDSCPNVMKTLAIQVKCGYAGKSTA